MSTSLVPPWVAAVVSVVIGVVTTVWGQALGTDVQTCIDAGAALVVAIVTHGHVTAAVKASTAPTVTPVSAPVHTAGDVQPVSTDPNTAPVLVPQS